MSIKQYDVITKLGAGSFGVVYKAKLKKTNQIFVIKQIEMSKLDVRLKKWAMNQAKLMKQINSPYIVKYFNSFVQGTKLFIVMEYCIKGDLCQYIKSQMGKPIKQQIIWKFTIQIMIGLHNLHNKKILHRDIKTLNIFLDSYQNIRIGDLGTAKTLSTDFTHTIVGTPYYLSPQLCQEKPYNQKTDIWAFGCLVYQLCTGKHPFQAQNQAALALKIVMGKFQDIPNYYSKDIRWIIQSCLSVDYKRRPSINFLLERPFVIENAKKLNLSLDFQSNQKSQKLQQEQKKDDPNKIKVQQIQAIVDNVYKKVDEAVKKVQQPGQKPPIYQPLKPNGSKKQIKMYQQNKYNKKQYDSLKKNHDSSLQKRKQIDQKRNNLPPKNQQKPINNNLNKNENPHFQNKSKQKVKIQNPPPARVVVNQKIGPSTAKINSVNNIKKNIIQTKKQVQKPKPNILNDKVMGQKRKSIQVNEFTQKSEQKKQFNLQDESQLKKQQTLIMRNLDCLDISKRSNKKQDNNINEQNYENAKKAAFVNNNIQKQVDDDLLMAEFGITPQKKVVLNDFSLMKTKSINWDLQQSKNSIMINGLQQQGMNLLQGNKTKTIYKQLPTIKTVQQKEQVSVLEQQQQTNQVVNNCVEQKQGDDLIQQDEDNKPYKSDDDQSGQVQQVRQKMRQKSNQKNKNDEQGFESDEQDSRYLIQNIQAQFAQDGKQQLQRQIEVYSKRLIQNKKRLIYLQNLRTHTQRQYFSHLSKQTYNRLKQQINKQNDKQVDRLIKQLTKGKDLLLMKFLKIMGFQIQIQRCQQNIKLSKDKINQFKIKLNNQQFI